MIKKNFCTVLIILSFTHVHVQGIVDNDHVAMQAETVNNTTKLMQLSSAHILARAIHVAAGLKIADHLVNGPLDIDILANKVRAHHDGLYRLMRLLASNDIFYEQEDKKFALTPLAMPLISEHPESLQSWLANHDGDEKRWRSYGYMMYSVQTGLPAFNHIFGKGYFDFIAQDINMAQSFDEGMRNLSEKEEACIADSYDFSAYKTITDIGGGKGGLIASIFKKYPIISAVLYDLPHVQVSAEAYLAQQGLTLCTSFVSGSFFEAIPSGSDIQGCLT